MTQTPVTHETGVTANDYTPQAQWLYQFAQSPGKTTTMKWFANIRNPNLQGNDQAAANYQAVLTEFGNIIPARETANLANDVLMFENTGVFNKQCNQMGKEWRPLGELDRYGRPNPFQDPQRGRIQIVTTIQQANSDAVGVGKKGVTPTDGSNIQHNILINLSGPTSIMGRGLKVFEQTADTDANKIEDKLTDGTTDFETGFEPQACCVIGEDKPPTTMSHYHYGYSGYGHGSYGHGTPSYGHSSPSYGGHGYGHSHSNQQHAHNSGHGHGIGNHTHHGAGHSSYNYKGSDPVGYSGYNTGSHSHGTGVTHNHSVSQGSGSHNHSHKGNLQPASVKAGINDWFGGKSFFGNMGKP